MEEEWAEIEGYSLYRISNTGRVWSKQWDRELRQSDHTKPRVTLLSDTYKRKIFKVEDLLKMAFGEQ